MTDIKLPPIPKPHTPPVFATAANTPSVKAGYELGGYEKTPPLFDEHQLEAHAREAVRLNATVPDGMVLVPVDTLKRWRDAFAEELSAWDIDPPLHHVQTSHDEIEALLTTAPAAPQPAQQTCNCRWVDDVQVQQCTLHQAHVEAVHEWAERAKTAEAKLIAAATGVKND